MKRNIQRDEEKERYRGMKREKQRDEDRDTEG